MNNIHNSQRHNKIDNIHTPPSVAKLMIGKTPIQPGDSVLDPSRGTNSIFYDNFPENVHKEWCEIAQGRDFFEYNTPVDWIIGNPPYSMWDKWIEHTCNIATKGFCYIFNFQNFTPKRLNYIVEKGFGLTKIHLLRIDWYISQSILAVFQRGKKSIISIEPNTVHCEWCGKRCGRNRAGKNANLCYAK